MQCVFRNAVRAFRSFRRDGRKMSASKESRMMEAMRTQCNVYLAQRLRRLHKIYLVYQQTYCEYAKFLMFSPIIRRLISVRPLTLALAACGIQWHEQGFSDDDMHQQIEDLMMVQNALNPSSSAGDHLEKIPELWQNVLYEPQIKMWRYPCDKSGLTKYKVHGTFSDISAKMFFNIQLDMDYRKKWDDLVEKLDVIDENRSKNEQVLQWVTRLPYPFAPREYLCIRRTFIDEKNKVMVISAKAVSHPSCKPSSKYVRVATYVSHMVIKPHQSFDELGFDYLMTYCDDPQIVLPNRFASWVISAGIPEYINKLHDACLNFNNTCNKATNVPSYLMN